MLECQNTNAIQFYYKVRPSLIYNQSSTMHEATHFDNSRIWESIMLQSQFIFYHYKIRFQVPEINQDLFRIQIVKFRWFLVAISELIKGQTLKVDRKFYNTVQFPNKLGTLFAGSSWSHRKSWWISIKLIYLLTKFMLSAQIVFQRPRPVLS